VGPVADDPTTRFVALATRADDPWPLDLALLLVAAHAQPGLDPVVEQGRLDDLAEGVPEPTFDGVRRHLFVELGFAGDRATYHDPRNSFLPDVLDRRLGIPISLAVLMLEVGRRVGVGVDGIGLPGHFVVRSSSDPDRYVDAYDGGRELDADGCRRLVELVAPGVPWDDAYLLPASPRDIVTRVLANLAGSYRRAGDRHALCWVLGLRLALPGASAQERRELGLLLGASGRFDEGAAVLEASPQDRDQAAAARLRARLN
jgi:regulator of sirC expression with transglutaminase-like and TPR domain